MGFNQRTECLCHKVAQGFGASCTPQMAGESFTERVFSPFQLVAL